MSERTQRRSSIWTPANIVTCVRIGLIPVLIAAMLLEWGTADLHALVSMALFALISLTDSVDGYLARSRNEVTTFGKFMDPIADKLLVVSALLVLVEQGSLPSWVPIVIVSRELLVSGLRMIAASRGVVIAASYFGKAKTLVTMLAICLFIIKDIPMLGAFAGIANVIAWVFMIAAVILTILSMADYFAKSGELFLEEEKASEPSGAEVRGSSNNESPIMPVAEDACDHPGAKNMEAEIKSAASQVIQSAVSKDLTVATAESLTGGLISGALTSISGSSAVVAGGVASYMARIKSHVLGVDEGAIERCGVVSSEVARQMAEGVRERLSVDVAVSVTGVAGPTGGTPQTPVGTVWMGVASDKGTRTLELHFQGSRDQVRNATVLRGLQELSEEINQL